MTIIEILNQRLGYKESMVISRDEFNELQDDERVAGVQYDELQEKLEELEGVQKQLDMVRELLDGIMECIDDEGVVTPEDEALLAHRIVAAVKFINNLEG